MKTQKELEQKFREQPDCTEYTASSGTEEKND